MKYLKDLGANPNVYAKVKDDGTMDCIVVKKNNEQYAGNPQTWELVTNTTYVSANWITITAREFREKAIEFKERINTTIQ